jgi:hypothetical protein
LTARAVEITVDTSDAPDLQAFGARVKSTLLDWFEQVGQILDSPAYEPPARILVYFDPNYDGVAYASGTDIVGSVDYYRTHQDDIGSMVHEMAHVIQAYKSCYTNEDWYITEGIADWVRFFHYEPVANRPEKPGSGNDYSQGYRVTAYFLDYVNTRYASSADVVYEINKSCREGTYQTDHSLFLRLTNKTIDVLWDEMIVSGKNNGIRRINRFNEVSNSYGYDHIHRHNSTS